jgi:CHAD domain-containing protein
MTAFRITRKETLADTYRRVVLEQINMGIEYSLQYEKDPDVATHEIRKITKRIRAMHRLFEEAAGKDSCKAGQNHMRSISILLAEHRLSKVYLDCLMNLSKDKTQHIDKQYFDKLIQITGTEHILLTDDLVGEHQVFRQVMDLLTDESERMENLPLALIDFTRMAAGIAETYQKGQDKLNTMMIRQSAESMHNLRKTVKCLWNQMMVVRPIWPSVIGAYIQSLDVLAEKLGNDHDLHELLLYLTADKTLPDSPMSEKLVNLINVKRKQLFTTIVPLAFRLFPEKPDSFSKRIISYAQVYLGEGGTTFYSLIRHWKSGSP